MKYKVGNIVEIQRLYVYDNEFLGNEKEREVHHNRIRTSEIVVNRRNGELTIVKNRNMINEEKIKKAIVETERI